MFTVTMLSLQLVILAALGMGVRVVQRNSQLLALVEHSQAMDRAVTLERLTNASDAILRTKALVGPRCRRIVERLHKGDYDMFLAELFRERAAP